MNIEFLKKAHERVPSVPVLVNLISKRELARGHET